MEITITDVGQCRKKVKLLASAEEIQKEKKSEDKVYHFLKATTAEITELEKSDIKFDKKENETGFIVRCDKKDKEAIEDIFRQSKSLSK